VNTVVFDLDGTLIDSYRDIAAALNDVLTSLELPPHDPEQVKTMIGGGVAALLARALRDRMDRFDDAKARFKDAYAARLVDTTRCYDGIVEMLDALAAADIACAVATNKPSTFTRELLERLDLSRRIAAFAGADEVLEKKPDPAVVRLALERAGPGSTALAYVGDMPVDLETSRRFATPFIGVSWGFDTPGLLASGCHSIASSPKELEAAVLRLRREKQGQASDVTGRGGLP
jgi:phosphoglycolate phosphatase